MFSCGTRNKSNGAASLDLASLVDPSRVVFGARANNKEQLLFDLAFRAAASLNLDPNAIINALRVREELGSAGFGEGFALPHAHIEGLDCFFGTFARLERPVHFDSVDAKPVELVFLLLIPATAQGEYVAALVAVSRHLRDKEFAARLRGASSVAVLCSLLCDPHHS